MYEQTSLAPTHSSSPKTFSNAQPPLHLFLLGVTSFGIYQLYWLYRNWKQFKEHKGLDIRPGWRTAAFIVPIYGWVLVYWQFRDIRKDAVKAGVEPTYSAGWMFLAWFFLNGLTSILGVWALTRVQKTLNAYWEKEQPGLPMQTGFSVNEKIILGAGGCLLLLGFLGMAEFPFLFGIWTFGS